MNRCETDTNYLSSPQAISVFYHTLAWFVTPTYALGFYCILYKTPPQMGSVKWLIFALHLECVFLDAVGGLFAVPYTILPAMGCYMLGSLASPSNHAIVAYMAFTTINVVAASVFQTVENRFFVLFGEFTWWRHFRKPVIVMNYCLAMSYCLPIYLATPEQTWAREEFWKSLQCQPEIPPNSELFVYSLDLPSVVLMIFICIALPFIQIGTFFLLNIYHLFFGSHNARLSQQTLAMQKKLGLALVIQCFTIMSMFMFPMFFDVFFIAISYHNQAFNNLIYMFVASHGLFSTFIMFLVHRPYRQFIFSPFHKMIYRAPAVQDNRSPSMPTLCCIVKVPPNRSGIPVQVLYVLNVVFCGSFGVSMAMFGIHFVFRYLIIKGNKTLVSSDPLEILVWLAIPIGYGIVWSAICMTTLFPTRQTDEFLRTTYLVKFPGSVEDLIYFGPFFYPNGLELDWKPCLGIAGCSLIMAISSLTMIFWGFKCYNRIHNLVHSTSQSNRYKAVQSQFLSALIVETLVPVFPMHVPAGVAYLACLLDTSHEIIGNVLTISIALYPAIDPLPTIMIISSYRNACLSE